MPYIPEKDRNMFEKALKELWVTIQYEGISKGELNYILSTVAKYYLERHGKSYGILSDIIGAFEGAKLEFYRRLVGPYEDKKIEENGDVY